MRGPLTTLWSSGASGACPARAAGEVAVTAMALDGASPSPAPRLYTAAGDKLRLWDPRMWECVGKVWSGHAAAVMCVALGRAGGGGGGGDLLATGSKDHYVRLADVHQLDTGSCEASNRRLLQPPHYDGVQALALTDDAALYSGSRDSAIKRWCLHDNKLTHSVMNAHKGWVTGVVWWRRGGEQLVASCGRDAALRVWAAPALRPLAAAALPDAPHALAAHPHHPDLLYTAGNGGEVRAWRLVAER